MRDTDASTLPRDKGGDQAASPQDRVRHFKVIAVLIAVTSFALLFFQAEGFLRPLFETMLGYSSGVLLFTSVCFGFHYFGRRFAYTRSVAEADGIANWSKSYVAGFRFKDTAIAITALIATVSCFTVYKAMLVGAQGYGYDQLFVEWDRWIFGGQDPWELTHRLFPSATATGWLNFLYHPAFMPMLIGYLVCTIAQTHSALRYTYMLSFLASYVIIGMVLAQALHSAGPAFDGHLFGDGTTFAPLMERLNQQASSTDPFNFLRAQEYLLNLHNADIVGLGGGISAMPSMHIVLAFLWVFAGWHLSRSLGVILTLYAALIWMTSVHLGWHYFVDGLVGLAVLIVIWWVMGRIVGLYGHTLRP